MTTQSPVPRGARSQSPSAKFYSRAFSTQNTSHTGGEGLPGSEDVTSSVPHSKRRKLNPGSDTEMAMDTRSGRYRTTSGKASQQSNSRQRDVTKPKKALDGGSSSTRAARASTGSAYTKRASALNLHNYPADHHPVGIAIWVIQKIESARRERSGSTSSRESSPEAFPVASSSVGFFQVSGQTSELDEGDEPGDRRQAQRERKIKQRLENWAKNKENDVVARAKLDAKKKFGSNPSTNPILLSNGQIEKPSPSDEKESYIRRRIREDFTRLMNRQTKIFADDVSKLEPFQVGFSQKCFSATNLSSAPDANLIAAGTLLVNVLPALAEKEVSRTSQLAADALIHALETGSLSPESFFDAIATLAENKDILAGSDRILAQLFSRSSTSGNTKVLRTSSGADSKLFATTNGPFIIYNTIENTEPATLPSTRHSARSFNSAISASARGPPRERKPTAKMLSVSEASTRPRTRNSMSPRTSPPKALRLTRPSKLRGSVSFAKSPSPPPPPPPPPPPLPPPSRKRVKLTDEHNPASRQVDDLEPAPVLHVPGQMSSMNQYQSEQGVPPPTTSGDQSQPRFEIRNDLVNHLFDLALIASQEDSDNSDMDLHEPNAVNAVIRPTKTGLILHTQPSPEEQAHQYHTSKLAQAAKSTARRGDQMTKFGSAIATSAEDFANFSRIMEQLPASEANLSQKQAKEVAALYDQMAQGPAFARAKDFGFSYPEIPRPFADRDGWKFTGVLNGFGEEIVEVDHRSWVFAAERPDDTQAPLRRLKRKAQLELEPIFGFPPIAGCGNAPQQKQQALTKEDEENVAYEKVMLDVRKAAEVRGLPCHKDLSWEELADSIRRFDNPPRIIVEETVTEPPVETVHDEPDDGFSSGVDASELSEIDSEGDSDYKPHPIVKNNVDKVWTGSNGAQMSTFVAINGRRGSLRKPKDPLSSSSSMQKNQNRAMDFATVHAVGPVSPGNLQRLNQPRHADMSPPTPSTKYDIRPHPLSGTFNTFNGPITSSNTPTASPAATPTFMKLNFNLSRKQASTSPAPSTNLTTSRRASTASISTSSRPSRPPSTQPLDIDNTNAYNAAKGYSANTTNNNGGATTPNTRNSSARNTSDDPSSSPGGLHGGYPGGGIVINAPEKRAGGDGRGQRRKSKAPDFKMTVQKAGKEGPKVQARAVRGGTVLKFT